MTQLISKHNAKSHLIPPNSSIPGEISNTLRLFDEIR